MRKHSLKLMAAGIAFSMGFTGLSSLTQDFTKAGAVNAATGENAVSVNFEDPIILKDYFGDDTRVIMAITLRADYDAWAAGILSFNEDKVQKQALIDLLD